MIFFAEFERIETDPEKSTTSILVNVELIRMAVQVQPYTCRLVLAGTNETVDVRG